jgi:hypothetical protein
LAWDLVNEAIRIEILADEKHSLRGLIPQGGAEKHKLERARSTDFLVMNEGRDGCVVEPDEKTASNANGKEEDR